MSGKTISMMRSRTTPQISTYDSVVTSPATTTRAISTRHSTATPVGSWLSVSYPSTESLIWSAILSRVYLSHRLEVNNLRVHVV